MTLSTVFSRLSIRVAMSFRSVVTLSQSGKASKRSRDWTLHAMKEEAII